MKAITAWLITILLIYADSVTACAVMKKGLLYSLNELIDNTHAIVLVEVELEDDRVKDYTIIQILKGEVASEKISSFIRIGESYIGTSIKLKHSSYNFNDHTNEEFWSNKPGEKIVRSPFFSGSCTPAFTFIEGEQYLIFLDSPASPYAAEIIKKKDDKWLEYTRDRLKVNSAFLRSLLP
jgi:hypothetical protein